MDSGTRELVRQRAHDRCEYCLILQVAVPFIPFHVEHVVAQQHQTNDDDSNLALACHRCNAYKGPNLSSIDPQTGEIVVLFHPRRDVWSEHFQFQGAAIEGLTGTGRATVRLLHFNDRYRMELREVWQPSAEQ